MDLNEIKVFVKVVQAGSFNQAAKQLEIPNSTASAKVSALEKRLGVTLLQRTTRKLHLTQTGETYFRRCLLALNEISIADAEINSSLQEAQGDLRVTAPIDLGNTCLTGMITAFEKRYPKVRLEFIFSDVFKDLVAEGIDLAIRAGDLKDSGLRSKKIGSATWVPYASLAYLKRAGTPTHPKEIGQHSCLHFSPLGDPRWELSNATSTVKVPITRLVSANDVNLIKSLAVAGKGIALLPTFACHPDVKAGKLVRILPQWHGYSDPIHLVYPDQKFVAPKVRAFLEIAQEEFKTILQA